MLLDYSASKGAQVAFTYSLAQSPEVLEKNIRVNAVAPGGRWYQLQNSMRADVATQYRPNLDAADSLHLPQCVPCVLVVVFDV